MVLYSAFPQSNQLIIHVLQLLGVDPREIVEVNGLSPINKRIPQIERFRDPLGPRIMLLSGVGTVGLNLQVANIMVIIVSLSAALWLSKRP